MSNDSNQSLTIDTGCGRAFLTATDELSQIGAVAMRERVHFANSLIYDERTDTCFAYDPRDAHRRRLELLDIETCESFDCFDCAYTAGQCVWDGEFNEC